MIIVSQDKEWIFNFNNTTSIGIDEENGNYYIRIISVAGKWNELGKYETKGRAKEVLQKITQKYESSEAKIGKTLITFEKYDFVYEMPKE